MRRPVQYAMDWGPWSTSVLDAMREYANRAFGPGQPDPIILSEEVVFGGKHRFDVIFPGHRTVTIDVFGSLG